MAPKELTSFGSSVLLKYASHRNGAPPVTGESYMESRRQDDGAEGLWRVHDGLYDLTEFISRHPGGQNWLRITKGTDITEAFESHHIAQTAADLLPKFFIRSASRSQPRNSPYTFHEDGFYKTFKRRAAYVLKITPDSSFSRWFNDGLVASCFLLLVSAAATSSYVLATVGAFCISITAICSHNFTHMRDNWRMYYLSLCYLSLEDWRISHILSHHQYPNTQLDMEISMLEPLLEYFPTKTKKTLSMLGAAVAFTVSACIMLPSKIPYRLDRDFGLGQLDATRDRADYGSNPVLVLSRYGDHALHHLLPTVDHCRLRALYPVFTETLAEFGIQYRFTTAWTLFKGSFKQLTRREPNQCAPGSVIDLKH
ncbi:cytochrome b5-related protein-like isoform X2 [Frankliniella occidentalis]|uniref:Cytochrome b5-related protein n=1 Tax=Frankliniella occidentalis TaxID=133901 RepID=A0A6J1T8A1_FRAOC|nr:cytochrome b5-related protein-like isoform X2 [Frankliniella occidentalis]